MTMARLRVVHLIPGLPIGGAERMLEDVVRGGCDASHTIVSLQGDGGMRAPLERAGADVVLLETHTPKALGHSLAGLYRLVRQTQPHVVHGWMYGGNVAALAASRSTAATPALVWGMHSVAPFWPHMGLRRRSTSVFNRLLAPKADALVYVAHTSAKAHAQAGFAAARACVIAGGVDTARFRPAPKAGQALRHRLGIGQQARIIGMLARYHPAKGHDTVMRAFAQLQLVSNAPELCHLVLVGPGLQRLPEALERLLPAELRPFVHCLGSQQDTCAIVQGLDVCTLGSYQEALPKCFLEALSAEILCAASDVGDVGALLEDVGWVVPPGSPKALAAAWLIALDCPTDEASRRRASGRQRIIQAYDQKRFVASMAALYRRLANRHAR